MVRAIVCSDAGMYCSRLKPKTGIISLLTNPYRQLFHAQSAMRSAIGEMESDEILHDRAKLSSLIKGSGQSVCSIGKTNDRHPCIDDVGTKNKSLE